MKKFIIGFFALIGFLVVVGGSASLYLAMKLAPAKPKMPESVVLTYHLHQDLAEHNIVGSLREEIFAPSLSLYDLIETLRHASDDSRVKGLVLRLDQAQLSLAKIQELHMALRRFKEAGKFVLAHVDTFGDGNNAMGQYYLASVADEIAMQPYGAIYLLGIGFDLFHAKKLLDGIRVKARFYKREEYKSAFDTFTEEQLTPANREAMTALARSLYHHMVRQIALERSLTEEEVIHLIEQSPLYGAKNALSLGLIDHIYYYDQGVKYALLKAGKEAETLSLGTYHALTKEEATPAGPSIALVYGVGTITRFASDADLMLAGEDPFSAESFEKKIEQVLKDPEIKALILRLNTPGGSSTATESMWRQIQRVREKGIPVVVSISDYGASGGYWLASGANAIIAHPSSIIGSIGVVGGKFVIKDVWATLGIQVDSIQFGQKAFMESGNHDFTAQEEESYQRMIDAIYKAFLIKVATGRQMDVKHVHALAKGRVWTGEDGYRLGLIDHLGDLSKAIDVAKTLAFIPASSPVNVVIFPKYKSVLERMYALLTEEDLQGSLILQRICAFLKPFEQLISFYKADSKVQARLDLKINS